MKMFDEEVEASLIVRNNAVPQLHHFSHIWYSVQVQPITLEELKVIILRLHPKLTQSFIDKLLETLFASSAELLTGADRKIASQNLTNLTLNLRETLKIIKRIACYSTEIINNESGYIATNLKILALKEIVDIIGGKLRSVEQFESTANFAAQLWGMTSADVDALLIKQTPSIAYHPNAQGCYQISVGRARLVTHIDNPTDQKHLASSSFAQTSYVKRLLERLAVSVQMNEPVILVGETGNGKTTNVQELARLLGKKLVVQNLSLSSDISDLLGGYRPVTIRQLFRPIYDQFVTLFQDTLSSTKNGEYLQRVAQFFHASSWSKLLKAIDKACTTAMTKLEMAKKTSLVGSHGHVLVTQRIEEWHVFQATIHRYINNFQKIENGFAFSFVKGLLLEAYQKGYWILMDEINLASAETLQGLSGFLDPSQQSMIMEDAGMAHSSHMVHRHPEFRVFAAMNPPTDICKKELPSAIRSRFTELYVPELTDSQDLMHIVASYFSGIHDAPIMTIVSVYLGCRRAAEEKLTDGAGQKPRYSLRSLTRSLKCAKNFMSINLRPLTRCLYEGFLLNFNVMLSETSQKFMIDYLKNEFYPEGNKKDLNFPPQRPRDKDDWILVKPFWMRSGPLPPVDWAVKDEQGVSRFVMTETVLKSIRCIAAAVASNAGSILLQGPTSIGKTSMIQYLAARLGKKCVRINNHEHTDVQEYIGGYITGTDGHLCFRDGLLVEALRNGWWIILDELNLAPSDVLEALNRLLDDNQELLIPETGEIIKPAEGFYLFATQNPPGVYGGRKPLSLAFRNRFVEIDLNDLPSQEIEEIITQSCGVAPKFSTMMVKVMEELQLHRQKSSMLLGKHGLITTRDLIKWGKRQPQNNLDVARAGYMLLAEKLRTNEEKELVEATLRTVCKAKDFTGDLYSNSSQQPVATGSKASGGKKGTSQEKREENVSALDSLLQAQSMLRQQSFQLDGVQGIAITDPLKRMWSLLYHAMNHSEPLLMVGETGCGKTMVCQLYAAFKGQKLRVLNCHQSTETADLIGGLRPLRGRDSIRANVVGAINSAIENGLLNLPCLVNENVDDIARLQLCQFPLVEGSCNDHDLAVLMVVMAKMLSTIESNQSEESSASGSFKIINQYIREAVDQWNRMKALFEWVDGPLIEAMKNGDIFLIDEINLAEDAVIERLNSVLEFHREITLAEKGGLDTESLVAHPNFRIIATMNPSGDFGKRELSPALRSRFSEVWIPANNSYADFTLIITEILGATNSQLSSMSSDLVGRMINFMKWFNHHITYEQMIHNFIMTIRELIAWAEFMNRSEPANAFEGYSAMIHGAFLTLLDGLGIGCNIPRDRAKQIKLNSVEFLLGQVPTEFVEPIRNSVEFLIAPSHAACQFIKPHIDVEKQKYQVGEYGIPVGQRLAAASVADYAYTTDAPSTVLNLGRIVRAMKIKRPILLEGPPGVGKTSVISYLAKVSGHHLVRINLSEHTELSDLLGSDLPCNDSTEGESSLMEEAVDESTNAPRFKWYDGILLKAMKEGSWVLLDELNLAPQTVLEGLNACFDHREQVYLPDIGQTVYCAPSFRVFSAQNPMVEGGGRKGLPASFLSRFTRVYMESMTQEDLVDILQAAYKEKFLDLSLPEELSSRFFPSMVSFINKLNYDITIAGVYGRHGSPWEFNLRDMLRWCDLIYNALLQSRHKKISLTSWDMVMNAAYFLFVLRMRSVEDRKAVCETFQEIFGCPLAVDMHPTISNSLLEVAFGSMALPVKFTPSLHLAQTHHREHLLTNASSLSCGKRLLAFGHEKNLETLAWCISLQWPVLLVGSCGSGKRSTVEYLAAATGHRLHYFSGIPSLDTSELLGAFEQSDKERSIRMALQKLRDSLVQLTYAFISRKDNLVDVNQSGDILLLLQSIHQIVHKYSSDADWEVATLVEEVSQGVIEMGQVIHHLQENKHTDIASLENSYEQAKEQWNHLLSSLQKSKSESFSWLSGVVVEAMERGYWLLFDNVNLCSSSVLDRLNSLLEPNGELVLNEDGSGRVVRRHENFRIFFAMDPSLGEVSRAMRNRCVELYYDRRQTNNLMLQAYLKYPLFPSLACFAGYWEQILALQHSYLVKAPNGGRTLAYYDVLHVSRVIKFILTQSLLKISSAADRVDVDGSRSYVLTSIAANHNLINPVQQVILTFLYNSTVSSASQSVVVAFLEQIECSFGTLVRQTCERNRHVVGPHIAAIRNHPFENNEMNLRNWLLCLLTISQFGDAIENDWQVHEKIVSTLLQKDDRMLYRALLNKMKNIVDVAKRYISTVQADSMLLTIYSHRSHTLLQELKEHSIGALDSTGQISNLLQLSKAVDRQTVMADSQELLVIGRLWVILSKSEFLLYLVAAAITARDYSGSCEVGVPEDEKILLTDALQKRDMLILRLQDSPCVDSKLIPWESILISVRWLQKAINKLLQRLSNIDHSTLLTVFTYSKETNETFSIFYDQCSILWKGSGFMQKMSLWKLGGHRFVPRKMHQWQIKYQLEAVISRFHIELPAFIETSNVHLIETSSIYRHDSSNQVMKDWLALYATFYWQCTNEVKSELKAALNVVGKNKQNRESKDDVFNQLVSPIQAHMDATYPSSQSDLVESFMSTEDEEAQHRAEEEALLDSQTLARIKLELKNRQVLALHWYADEIVLSAITMLRKQLAEVIYHPRHLLNILSHLQISLRSLLDIGLQYSTFDPQIFRECQTLLWFVEFVQSISSNEVAVTRLPWIDILSLLRAILVGLESNNFLVTAFNLSNHVQRIDLSYTSKTLAKSVDSSQTQSVSIVTARDGSDQVGLNGWSRGCQAASMTFAARHIDLHLLFPGETVLSKSQSRMASLGHAQVSIAAYERAQSSLVLAMQGALMKNRMDAIHKKLMVNGEEYSEVKLHMVDILVHCKSLFAESAHPVIDELVEDISRYQQHQPILWRDILERIRSVDLVSKAVHPVASDLLKNCLQPLLTAFVDDEELGSLVLESYASVALGVLYIHLVLSNGPVDPAMKPFHKHSMLSPVVSRMTNEIQSALMVNVFSNQNLVDANIVKDCYLVDLYAKQDATYLRNSIERPEGIPSYLELYHTLQSILQGPLQAVSIMNLASRLLRHIKQQQSKSVSSSVHTLKQEELNLQATIFSSYHSLKRIYGKGYEDIIGILTACLDRIARGMRLLITVAHSNSVVHQLTRKMNLSVSSHDLHKQIWSQLLSSHPFSSHEMINVKTYKKNQKDIITRLINPKDGFVEYLSWAFQQQMLMSAGQSNTIVNSQRLSLFQNQLSNLLHLLALHKVKSFVDGSLLSIKEVNRFVNHIVQRFVQQYLRLKELQREKRAEENALFVHKKPKPAITPELSASLAAGGMVGIDAEEEQEFRENFPNHLAQFNALLETDEDTEEKALPVYNETEDDDKFIEDPTLLTASSTISAEEKQRKPAKSKHSELQNSNQVDRDLLLLLDVEGEYRDVLLSGNGTEESNKKHDILFSNEFYNPVNFHFDSQITEVVLANGPLNQILQRAIGLLQVLPNNDVLLRIIKLTYHISLLHITVPLGKLINSIQLLLKYIQQYEDFAHREISFNNEIALMSQLLRRYRSQELTSWNHLLRTKEVSYAKQAMAYWFSMIKVFKLDLKHQAKKFQSWQPMTSSKRALQWTTLSKHAPSWLFADYQHVATKAEQSSSLEEQVENYLTDKLKMLENFLLDSNLGQFPMRLHLIRLLALAVQLDRQEYEAEEEKKAKDLLKKLKQHQQAAQSPTTISCFLREVENLLFGMWRSYANYLTNVRQFQDLFQQPLQQKVKDEVKLNKWDDITVIALIENSEKINRKLNKYLKQYQEEVLDYPVRRLIYRENMKDLIDEQGERIPSYEVPSQAILFPVVQSSSSSSSLLLQKVEAFYKLYHWQAIQSQQQVPKQQSASLSQEMISAFPRLGRLSKLVRKVDKHLETLFSFPDMSALVEDPSQCEHLCLVGMNFSLLCEEACQNVFDRLQTLRGEKVNMQVKKKALRDFFSFLHEQGGYSHLRSEVPAIACLSNPIELFQSASLLPQLQARSLSSFESMDKDLLSKGEKYLTKSLVELSQLRVQVSSRQHHPDVTTIESLHMVTYCESMLTHALQSRAAIEAGLRNLQSYSSHLFTLSQEIHRFQGSSIANPSRRLLSAIEMQQLVDQNLHTFRIAYQLLADLLAVIQRVATGREGDLITSSASLSSSSQWVSVLSEVISMLGDTINQHLAAEEEQRQKYALTLVTAPDITLALHAEDVPVFLPSLEEIDNHQQVLSYLIGRLDTVEEEVELFYGREAGVFKAKSLLTAVFENNQTLLRGEESERVKDDDTSAKKVLQAMNHLLEESLLTMQHLTTLHDNYHATTGSDLSASLQGCFGESLSTFNQEGKEWTLRELHSWSLAVLSNCQRSYPIESTRRLLNFLQPLSRVDDSVLGLLTEMQGLGIRLRCVSAALVEEVALGYKAQTKLLYLALRLFRHLLAKGYCHKQGEEEGDGEGEKEGDPMRSQTWQEEQDGTGMGEGEGRKDVSNQITNEEQLLDLKQDQEKPADEGEKPSTEKPKPQEDQKEEEGVEMQQDFQGDLFDLPEGGDEEEEDDDEDDQDSIDRELDHDQQPMDMDNVVSEKQWDDDSDEEQEDQQQQEKFERDNAMDGPALEDEMHTKETGDDDEMDEEGGDQKEQQPKPKTKDHQQEEEGQDEEQINEDHEEDYMQKPQGVEMQKKEDERAQQQEEDEEDQEGEEEHDAEGEKEEDGSTASPFPEQEEEEGASGEPQLDDEGQRQEMDEDQGKSD
eukprot:scaffold521_cov177-Ochromonas_danica.AAC.7